MSSLPEALADFLKKEELTGDNQYQVPSYASFDVYLVNSLLSTVKSKPCTLNPNRKP